jgi:molybdopterin-guanine dinucleotide biosynthesis protein A
MLGILLMGGRSRRMGRNKAELDWCGQPLWQHMLTILRSAGCTTTLAAGSSDCPDPLPNLGPLGGLLRPVQDFPDRDWLLCPVDMPLLSPALLNKLMTQPGHSHYHAHALPCVLRASHQRQTTVLDLLALPEPRQRNLRHLLCRLGAKAMPCTSPQALLNTNTPAQWRQCRLAARIPIEDSSHVSPHA